MAKLIAKLEHLPWWSRKGKKESGPKRTIETKLEKKERTSKGNEGRRKDKSNKKEIEYKVNETQNWIQNQFWFISECENQQLE